MTTFRFGGIHSISAMVSLSLSLAILARIDIIQSLLQRHSTSWPLFLTRRDRSDPADRRSFPRLPYA